MSDTALLLARAQFAANITFHILFPTISIALGWVLLYFRTKAMRTGEASWEAAYMFWTKIFALTFALGVVSGITMSFQFGTNWPGFMAKVGNIAGPLLGYEVLTAFFLEASFLGIMLFGRSRVSPRTHWIATCLVAVGTTASAFWILALNSWMQTPTGFEIIKGVYHPTDWWAIVFNPSFPYRFVHTLLASGLTVAFLLAGVSAWQIIKGVADDATQRALRAGVLLGAILIPVQIAVGDLHGLNTLKHQPAKIAAIEGIWETQRGAPLVLFGVPDKEAKTTHYAIEVPKLAAFILTHDPNGELKGLNEFAGKHPPVAAVFYSFRIMVGVGTLMLLVSWWAAWTLRKKRALSTTQLRVLAGMTFSGWIATVSGWYVTEIGRQPYIVYGEIMVAETAATHASALIGLTFALYLVMYVGLLIAYVGVVKRLAERPTRGEAPKLPTAQLSKPASIEGRL